MSSICYRSFLYRKLCFSKFSLYFHTSERTAKLENISQIKLDFFTVKLVFEKYFLLFLAKFTITIGLTQLTLEVKCKKVIIIIRCMVRLNNKGTFISFSFTPCENLAG